MKKKILLITAGILVLSAVLLAIFGISDISNFLGLLLLLLILVGLVGLAIGFLTILVSLPLWLIDWLVFKVWLGRKTDKYDRFYELSTLWLTLSYKLPLRMSKRGVKYGWLGACLMLVSPVAVVTYATAFCVQQVFFPFPLSEEEVPYKTHEELVAITGLSDFPAFTYSHNERDGWDGSVTIYYKFERELSSAYAKKLEALCEDPDNYLWEKGDSCYVLRRGSDGEYIKLPITCGQIELKIRHDGFVITEKYDCSICIEDFAERKTLNKKTGVTFPEYKVVNNVGEAGRDVYVEYYLLLDEKPSQLFIKQLENSPKWTKNEDGTYSCGWGENGHYSERVTVDKNSRVVKAIYETY